jgi:hypothetical protein
MLEMKFYSQNAVSRAEIVVLAVGGSRGVIWHITTVMATGA